MGSILRMEETTCSTPTMTVGRTIENSSRARTPLIPTLMATTILWTRPIPILSSLITRARPLPEVLVPVRAPAKVKARATATAMVWAKDRVKAKAPDRGKVRATDKVRARVKAKVTDRAKGKDRDRVRVRTMVVPTLIMTAWWNASNR